MRFHVQLFVCCLAAGVFGCSQGPTRVPAPSINPIAAAEQALELYDVDHDGALNEKELAQCPGILQRLTTYDQNENHRVDREEIVDRIANWVKSRIGLTQVISTVTYQGKPLAGATIVFEPEPYLGSDVKVAQGLTNAQGLVQMAIAAENLPEQVRKRSLMQCGTYKVRITHPSIKLPTKYNTETTLGYETTLGNPYAEFSLKGS
jgi:hypothetical protein